MLVRWGVGDDYETVLGNVGINVALSALASEDMAMA